jgi:NAD(P)H dehydrogenase (quinone)
MSSAAEAAILVIYYSRQGSTARLAREICRGIEAVPGARAILRSVPPVSAENERPHKAVPEEGAPWASLDDLRACDGLVLGSPTRFGNMAAPLKHFLDQTASIWVEGALVDKPAAVFTSTQAMHGGQESTLVSMLLPLMHHGMAGVGVPFTEAVLSATQSGGTPYGASHVVAAAPEGELTTDEITLARALGKRVATLALRLRRRDQDPQRR